MIKPTKHQEIWERKEDDSLVLVLPKIINSDIGFQLMFGHREDHRVEEKRLEDNANKYNCKTYINVEDFKKYI